MKRLQLVGSRERVAEGSIVRASSFRAWGEHVIRATPRVRIIPELFGGGALPRKELKEAAMELTSEEAGLIMIGEPTIEKGFDKAVTGAAKVVKRSLDATSDEIASELKEALKS